MAIAIKEKKIVSAIAITTITAIAAATINIAINAKAKKKKQKRTEYDKITDREFYYWLTGKLFFDVV